MPRSLRSEISLILAFSYSTWSNFTAPSTTKSREVSAGSSFTNISFAPALSRQVCSTRSLFSRASLSIKEATASQLSMIIKGALTSMSSLVILSNKDSGSSSRASSKLMGTSVSIIGGPDVRSFWLSIYFEIQGYDIDSCLGDTRVQI